MFSQTTQRFSETLQGMRQMAAEMQRELETTRNELRRGILELPQETADSASQMRRVIVDQIEALAELNRIVARHGRGLDAVEPPRRAPEPVYATAGGRRPPRMERAAPVGRRHAASRAPTSPAPLRCRRRAAPMRPRSPRSARSAAGNGWLSELLNRASKTGRRPRARRAPGPPHAGIARTRSPSISRG